jgi:hypothetical protein
MVGALLQILHIEEGALPFLARLLPLQPREACGLASIEGGCPTGHRDRANRLGLKVNQSPEQLDAGPDTKVCFAEGCECGQGHHHVFPNMVRLQMEMVQELP